MRAAKWNLVINDIIAAIATTPQSLGSICEGIKGAPSAKTFWGWLEQDEDLRKRYACAREAQMQVLADEIIDIADTTQMGEIVTEKADGSTERKMADMIEHRKLRIESRKWLMGKLKPKVYGDKTQQEITGVGGGPLQAEITVKFV